MDDEKKSQDGRCVADDSQDVKPDPRLNNYLEETVKPDPKLRNVTLFTNRNAKRGQS